MVRRCFIFQFCLTKIASVLPMKQENQKFYVFTYMLCVALPTSAHETLRLSLGLCAPLFRGHSALFSLTQLLLKHHLSQNADSATTGSIVSVVVEQIVQW